LSVRDSTNKSRRDVRVKGTAGEAIIYRQSVIV